MKRRGTKSLPRTPISSQENAQYHPRPENFQMEDHPRAIAWDCSLHHLTVASGIRIESRQVMRRPTDPLLGRSVARSIAPSTVSRMDHHQHRAFRSVGRSDLHDSGYPR